MRFSIPSVTSDHLALIISGLLQVCCLTNMDTERMRRLIAEPGVDVVSNQVSFSVVDTRPRDGGMAAVAQAAGAHLLCYGALLGGLLSDTWRGHAAPRRSELATASLGKYYQFVQAWGSWELFQELLDCLHAVGARHNGATIANVATRWVLQQQAVGGVILGMSSNLLHLTSPQSFITLSFSQHVETI